MFIYRSLRLSVPAYQVGYWKLDSTKLGPHIVALMPNVSYSLPIKIYRHRRLLTYGSNWGQSVVPNHNTPIWIFEKTDNDDLLVIDNSHGQAFNLWISLVGVFGDWQSDIDKGLSYKSSCKVGVADSNRDEIFVKNDTDNKDYVVKEIIANTVHGGNIYNSNGDIVIDYGESAGITTGHFNVNIVLKPGEYLFSRIYQQGGFYTVYVNQANYWVITSGSDVPNYIPQISPDVRNGVNPFGSGMPYIPVFPSYPPISPLPVKYEPPVLNPWPYPEWPSIIPDPNNSLPKIIDGLPYSDLPSVGGKVPKLPWQGVNGVTSLIGIGPLRTHLLHMDSYGRVRYTDQAITYNSGIVDKSDSTESIISPSRPSSRISLKSVVLSWQIKILTVYDVLKGLDFDDKDTIYLDAGDVFEESIEAVKIKVICPDASESSHGKIYYYIGE